MSAGLRQRRLTGPAADDRSPWHAVLQAAIACFLALHVVAAIMLTDIEAAALTLVLVIVLVVRRRLARAGTIALALLFVNMAAWVLPGTVRNLAGAAPVAAVLLQAALGATAVLGLVALFGERRAGGSARTVRAAVAAAVAVVVVATGLATTREAPVTPRAGDLEVVASSIAFAPTDLAADVGTVTVHLTNEDFFWHTFSIPALGVSMWVPVEGADRVTFEAPAGTWTYSCEIPGHGSAMRGQLVVGP